MEKHAAPPRVALLREHILDGLIGNSAPTGLLNELIGKISRSDSPVLLFPPDRNELVRLTEIERRAVLHALRKTGADKHAAALVLGIGKSSFYRKAQGVHHTTPPLPKDQEPRAGH